MVQVTSLGSRVIAGQNQDVYRSETHVRSWRDHFTKIFSQGPALSRPPANLSTDQQKLLKIRSVQAVAWRARFWVATLLVANVLTFTFAERDLNYGYLIPIWSVGVWLLALIPYIFLTYFANILTENSSTSAIRLVHALLCVWIAGLSILWWFGAMGIKFIPFGSRPSTGQFLFIRQFFIFTTLSGQVMPIVLFSASTIARLSVFVPSMCLLTIAWYFGVVLTQTAFIIWNTTQLCLYLLISWIVGRDEQASQIRAFIAEDARLRLNTFLGSLSHDMRSPLSAMTLMLAVMKAKNTSPDLDQDLDKIRSQAIALESMMNGTLDLSRLVAGTWDVRVEDISLPELIEKITGDIPEAARRVGLHFDCKIGPYIVASDPTALARILRNLIGNALRYTPAMSKNGPGRVTLECELKEQVQLVRISVVDNGIGIPRERRADIFRPFVQLSNPERNREKGFGLGLYIVEGLANLLGHNCGVESEPGEGSRFWVDVPFRAQVPAALPDKTWFTADREALSGMIVLLIEDDPVQREPMSKILYNWGCTVVAGETAREALDNLRQLSSGRIVPDFILADWRLPEEKTGVEAIAAVRAAIEMEVPAAIWTADARVEILQQIAKAGIVQLAKPLDLKSLWVLLNRHGPKGLKDKAMMAH